jgi:hypothetical protein
MAHDRAEGDRFPMTQEFMSMMLGCGVPACRSRPASCRRPV